MWRKLVLLAAVVSAVRQVLRYWHQAGAQATARRQRDPQRDPKHELHRWENEGGKLATCTARGGSAVASG